jgi:hypothetical protein
MLDLIQIAQYPHHESLKYGLLEFALKLRGSFPNCNLGVMPKGWSSPRGQWERGSVNCRELTAIKEFIYPLLPEEDGWDFESWFNIMKAGCEIKSHNHFLSQWAAAYHVEGEGDLIFESGAEERRIETRPGRIAIFPGLLKHRVDVISCERRVSIGINANRVVKLESAA